MNNESTTVAEEALDELRDRFLTFYIEDTFYSIELCHIIEIISIQLTTYVPGLPEYFKGIINLRGKVVPVIDVRLKFGQPPREYDDKTCIIIVTIHDMQVGLIVDRVAEVVSIETEHRNVLPTAGNRNTNRYLSFIAKVDNKAILNIDCEKFFLSDLRTY